ncbi:MAG: DMT family transporter [Gammaproteobacteria bacterium]
MPSVKPWTQLLTLHPERLATISVLIGAIFISFAPVYVRLANVEPVVAGFYRVFLAGIFFLPWICFKPKQRSLPNIQTLILSLTAGICFASDLMFWHLSIRYVGPGVATLLGNMQIFFLILFSYFLLKEAIPLRIALTLPLASFGLILLVGDQWHALGSNYHYGVVCGLLTGVFYSGYTLCLRQIQALSVIKQPVQTLTLICFMTALVFMVIANIQHQSLFHVPPHAWGWLLAYSLLAQGVGWLLITYGIPHIKLSLVGFLLLLQPSFAFVWDTLFLHRATNLIQLSGLILTLYAIYLSSAGKKKR